MSTSFEMIESDDSILISVLMPTYNVEKFVGEAVESILAQSWQNFELIIVDDCSTDRTYDILKTYLEKDSRIRLYRNEKNSKICKTLNTALENAKGSYIVQMDGDDISTQDRFAKLYQYLQTHPKIDIVGSNVITIDERGKKLSHKRFISSDKGIKVGNRYMPCVLHIWMARRQVYDKLGGYRDIPYAEDFDFLLRGELIGLRYANVQEYLYYVRIRNGNTGSSNGLVQRKTADYVKRLHKIEKETGKDQFDVAKYNRAIYCTDQEKERYALGATLLEKAIRNKNNPALVFFYVMRAAFTSWFEFKYLLEAIAIRIVAICIR